MKALLAERFSRKTVSGASRVMLPSYPVLCLVVGITYIATPRDELRLVPSYQVADKIVAMPAWGVLFTLLGVLQVVALVFTHGSYTFQFSLAVTGIAMVVWAAVGLGSWVFGDASAAAWVWPAFVAQACRASVRSLKDGKV